MTVTAPASSTSERPATTGATPAGGAPSAPPAGQAAPGDRAELSDEASRAGEGDAPLGLDLGALGEAGGSQDGQGPLQVQFQRWGSGKNDCLWNILKGVGYSDQEIVSQGLVDKVSQMNGLDDKGTIHPGQTLQVPRKGEGGQPLPGAGQQAPQEAPQEPGPGGGAPPPAEAPAPGQHEGSDIGLRALGYGVDSPQTNPNTGDQNWYMWCLGWVNRAVSSAGGNVSELQAPNARAAYDKALANGRIQYGSPPPGAIVFFPESAGGLGHVGIATDSGHYRGTVPPGENARTIGDRAIPDPDRVAWMMPY